MITERSFDSRDQAWFAACCGDHNPLHMNSRWAERHFPGAQVVHGVHILLWALDELLQARSFALGRIHTTWIKPVMLGDMVRLEWDAQAMMLRAFLGNEPVMVARLKAGDSMATADAYRPVDGVLAAPILRDFETMVESRGTVALPREAAALGDHFPALSRAVGANALAGLASLSTLVGMHCPGLYSMLSEVDVTLSYSPGLPTMRYEVTRWIPQFSRVEMKVYGLGLDGQVLAFAGQPEKPVADETLRQALDADTFTGSTPLVIGASAGLGGMTARLLAAGGARPLLTWRHSENDLQEIRDAITALGGQSDAIFFDVLKPRESLDALRQSGWQGKEVYYFATPRIFRRHLNLYDRRDLDGFWSIYVDGFFHLATGLEAQRPGGTFRIFYPSSIAIEEDASDLLEYAMAKAAGERLCRRLQQKFKQLKIVVERLPRTQTRQTETFVKAASKTTMEVMLPVVLQMQRGDI